MEIVKIKLKDIVPYEGNAKMHPREQVEQIKKSIQDFGNNDPIAVDENNVIIEGHGRYMALIELGYDEAECIVLTGLTDDQKNAYRLVHNKLTMNSDFDFEILKSEVEKIEMDMSQFDFDMEGIAKDLDGEKEAKEDDFDVDEAIPEEPITKLGDVWKLGNHYLMCGDSTKKENVEKLMSRGGYELKKADLVFTDPPYGMKKEKDGVLNDNLNYDDLLEFNKKWIPLTFEALKENGSWYCWGIDEPLMDIYSEILKPMQRANKITFRNLITWKKENDNPTMIFNGACASNNRSYYTNEKCLFAMCGVQGFNNNKDHYDEAFEPIRSYLELEAKKVGLTSKKLTEITGVQMFGHWFTKSQFTIIPKEYYLKLQKEYGKHAFSLDYDEMKNLFKGRSEEYKTLKEAVMAKRAYFDPNGGQCIDVWVHDVTSQKERELTGGHATPKPIALCARAIKSSSRENEIVLDVFGGSGSTLIACEQLNRVCYTMELDPKYCDVIIKRWETLTGNKAELIK